MSAFIARLAARFDALARRERYLVALALIAGGGLLFWSLLIDPARMRQIAAERGIADQRAQLAALTAQSAALQAPGHDPEALATAELAAVKGQIEALYARYQALGGRLVAPQQVGTLLEELLGQHSGLRLLSLRTLPVAPVLGDTNAGKSAGKSGGDGSTKAVAAASAEAAAGLYQHGVEIRLEGSYAELTAYLERLENSPQKLLWNSVSLSAADHPRLVLTLTVSTLSLDRTWLIV